VASKSYSAKLEGEIKEASAKLTELRLPITEKLEDLTDPSRLPVESVASESNEGKQTLEDNSEAK